MQVLIVEDDVRLALAVGKILEENGYQVDLVYDGQSGLDYAESGIYDVVILDVMLPKMDGFEVAKQLRRKKVETPLLMLTARGAIPDKIEGLDSGADDYMTKPFESAELLARLRALTRRQGDVVMEQAHFADLTLDLTTHDLSCGEKSVHLSGKEFEVMQMLMGSTSRIVSKQDLLTRVWGTAGEASENSVEAYVSFLRKKISHIGSKVQITTLRMLGYHLETLERD